MLGEPLSKQAREVVTDHGESCDNEAYGRGMIEDLSGLGIYMELFTCL